MRTARFASRFGGKCSTILVGVRAVSHHPGPAFQPYGALLKAVDVLHELLDVLAVPVADQAARGAVHLGDVRLQESSADRETCDSWRCGGGLASRFPGTTTSLSPGSQGPGADMTVVLTIGGRRGSG